MKSADVPVVMNDFRAQWLATKSEVMEAVAAVGQSGWLILGEQVSAFEHQVAPYLGVDHCVGCASGLDALEIAMRLLKVGPGSRVITTPLTAFATTLAIVRLGATPVFIDVDPSGLLNLDMVESALRSRRADVLLPVHLYGHSLDLERLATIAGKYEIPVIEDCAQSLGARWNGRAAGSVGEMAATSFYPTKNLGAWGDGGALATNSALLASQARAMRDYGQSTKYVHDSIGMNSRLDELHAAIMRRAMLPRLASWTQTRLQVAQRYLQEIRNPRIERPPVAAQSESVWHLFPVLVRQDRDGFMKHMRSLQISTAIHYPTLTPHQNAMTSVAFEIFGELTLARQFAAAEVSLPIHPFLDESMVSRVIEACNAWGTQ